MKGKLAANMVVVLLMVSVVAIVNAPSVTFVVPIHQATFQWRAWNPMPDEGVPWSELYQNYDTTMDCRLSGKVLHTYYEYSPVVEVLEGESTIYVLDSESGVWLEREGTIQYKYPPYYGDHYIVNYFRGYLEFDGDPSESSFMHGVAYQWVYLEASEQDGGILPYAQWDEVMGMWLLGFQIYVWDVDTFTQSYSLDFEFVEPVPAHNYNPFAL